MTHAAPQISPEQRAVALQRAAEARRAKSDLLKNIREKSVTLTQVLTSPEYAEQRTVKRLSVLTLLRAVPGISAPAAKAFMNDAHISLERRVGGLGPRQRELILSRYQDR